ncbi:AtpZ/AtpI family protein [Tumidithrix elongata RA019]|uniref:AtpZ/AtpI family protein n=1 Tax=Tumidithrix elongata BACA0141 TaxID=2716417 RepID=A0AAW9Q3P3_9CYAN|nr:AtpZ/AtpI family protein [Tumidithrix elongata RA019]
MKSPESSRRKARSPAHDFTEAIATKEQRKLHARQTKPFGGVWFGLGFAGLVGWSVVAPTLLGMALGMWIDRQFPSQMSWTLALMLGGLTLGCLVAWQWVAQEQERMVRSQAPLDRLTDPDPDIERNSETEVKHD